MVGGLVLSFAVFTLLGSWLLSALDLPQDLLRWIGLVVLGLVGLGLIVPVVGEWLERPFARLARGRQHSEAGGFVLGLSLGLVFVPCAGPVLTAIAVVSANHRYGFSSILLTAAFALGVAVPLLIFAVLGQRLAERMRLVRARAALARRVIGAVLVVTALVIGLNLTDGLQRACRATPTPSRATSSPTPRPPRPWPGSAGTSSPATWPTAPRRARSSSSAARPPPSSGSATGSTRPGTGR